MVVDSVWIKVEGSQVGAACDEAAAKLDNAGGEVVLDFSGVVRIDPGGLAALEKLAAKAKEKTAKVTLCGVHVDVYKVLKLVKLTTKFSFMG